jgi:hypothetical protein
LIEEMAHHNRTSRFEREVEDLLREAEFARQAIIVIEEPKQQRGLRRLALNVRAFLF